jgi:redox-sensitive bicupin YhaK (pirin superfamily)
MKLAVKGFTCSSAPLHQTASWVKEYLSDYGTVHVHLLKMLAVNVDVNIRASAGINYFHVSLKDGEKWRYTPPAGHSVAWLSVDEGRLRSSEAIHAGQLAVFEETGGAIELQADGVTSFVIGSAIKHPHPLILGKYSVHTNAAALAQGEGEIRRIGERLRAEGRL